MKQGITLIVNAHAPWNMSFVWNIERILTGENKNITGHTFRNVLQNPVKLQTGGVRHGFIFAYGIHVAVQSCQWNEALRKQSRITTFELTGCSCDIVLHWD